MADPEFTSFSSRELFISCASNLDDRSCWDEFIRRYHQTIARGVAGAFRRFTPGSSVPGWRVAELVQEVYLRLVREDCELLRRFRGHSEGEAARYLAQIALNLTADELRREATQKRRHLSSPLDDEPHLSTGAMSPYTAHLAEREAAALLARLASGPHSRRDLIIFMLRFREGLSSREIARLRSLNLRPSGVAAIIARMQARLRRSLDEDEVSIAHRQRQ